MKWDPPDGSVQFSADKRYSVVRANSKDFIAYRMNSTTAEELGVKSTDAEARHCCEDHLAQIDADKGTP